MGISTTKIFAEKAKDQAGFYKDSTGDKHSMYGIKGRDHLSSKPLLQFTKDMVFVREWASAAEVERTMKFRFSNIGKCVTDRSKTAYGFIWKFKEKREYSE